MGKKSRMKKEKRENGFYAYFVNQDMEVIHEYDDLLIESFKSVNWMMFKDISPNYAKEINRDILAELANISAGIQKNIWNANINDLYGYASEKFDFSWIIKISEGNVRTYSKFNEPDPVEFIYYQYNEFDVHFDWMDKLPE